MNIIALILSFYFLGLNFIPCDDTVESNDQDTISVNLTFNQDNQDQQHDDKSDGCPPFCQCHCCHVHVVNFHPGNFEVLDLEIPNLIVQKAENPGIEILDSHFQPPRL
ncbi:DUF6660 family protein [Gillisia sp. Q332]|uniref:DUF6660 family protein n=1 Tax=Gillisia xinjiangensis TaxID=3384765 RepID=UPI00391C4D03